MMSSKEISPSLFTSTCFSSHLWPHFDLPPPLISHWQEFILMHDPPIFISFPLLTGFWASFSLDLPLVISPPNLKMGFPWWLSGKESACQCRRRWFNSWVRKIPWRRKWLPSPGKSLGQRSLVGYSPWDCRRVRWLSNSTMTTTTDPKIVVTGVSKDVEWESVRTSWKDLCFLSFSVEGSPESLENEDFSSSSAITVFKDTSQGAVDQLSLILSPEHQISQKFYIPRSTATAALGAAARLATSNSLLHWYPSVKKMETWGPWGGKGQPEA